MKWFLLTFIVLLFPVTALAQSEKQLIQEHLQLVEEGLRLKDVRHLPQSQQHARKQNLDNLRKYWQAGIFPKNTKHPNQRVPYFIDDGGRACAMAHLLIESGHKETALQIQLRENNAYVHDIKSPELSTWLKTSGLTIDEAAWIQPAYKQNWSCDCKCDVGVVNDGHNLYINECVATRCNRVRLSTLWVGCDDITSSVVLSSRKGATETPEFDVCYEEKQRLRQNQEYHLKWTQSALCMQPAANITGDYPHEDDAGCVMAPTRRPSGELWPVVFLLLFIRRRVKRRTCIIR